MRVLKTGAKELRTKANEVGTVRTHTANGAITSTTSGQIRLNGASLAMTVAAPTVEGVELWITNVAGSAATVTIATGMDANSTADVFTLAAASATVRAALLLQAINTAAAGAAPTLVWSSFIGAGTTVA